MLVSISMKAETEIQKIEWLRPADLPGVEVVRADCSSRLWHVFHTTYSICSILHSGITEWTYRSKIQYSRTGHLMLMEPGELHAGRKIIGTARRTFRVLNIDHSLIQNAAMELGIAAEPHFRLASTADPMLFGAFKRLHVSLESESTTLERQSLFASCVRLLLERGIETRLSTAPRCPERPALRRAQEFIHENHSRPDITLDDLATITGLSRFYLVRAFAREFGLPPHAYQNQVRIAKARTLLTVGWSVGRVAEEMGFSDQSHFARHFRKALGLTPTEYMGKQNKPSSVATSISY